MSPCHGRVLRHSIQTPSAEKGRGRCYVADWATPLDESPRGVSGGRLRAVDGAGPGVGRGAGAPPWRASCEAAPPSAAPSIPDLAASHPRGVRCGAGWRLRSSGASFEEFGQRRGRLRGRFCRVPSQGGGAGLAPGRPGEAPGGGAGWRLGVRCVASEGFGRRCRCWRGCGQLSLGGGAWFARGLPGPHEVAAWSAPHDVPSAPGPSWSGPEGSGIGWRHVDDARGCHGLAGVRRFCRRGGGLEALPPPPVFKPATDAEESPLRNSESETLLLMPVGVEPEVGPSPGTRSPFRVQSRGRERRRRAATVPGVARHRDRGARPPGASAPPALAESGQPARLVAPRLRPVPAPADLEMDVEVLSPARPGARQEPLGPFLQSLSAEQLRALVVLVMQELGRREVARP